MKTFNSLMYAKQTSYDDVYNLTKILYYLHDAQLKLKIMKTGRTIFKKNVIRYKYMFK